ncbi:probable BOI-related E3 ubiquitin-protein ligase 2 [Euphorbia lathyris]|uniref:probable BOI-related E3 ubiquitin-protein ligase 2 n=1 Tax=Euphorbia lathyris TaxID=212925 RepID=UPI003313C6A3
MAVEARHLNLFPPQLLSNRDLMMNAVESNANMYNSSNNNNNNNAQIGMAYRGMIPAENHTQMQTQTLIPMYSCVMAAAAADSIPQKTPIKSESGLSYNHHLPPPQRKRSRESMNLNPNSNPNPNHLLSYQTQNQMNKTSTATATATSPFSFLGHDISLQIHQQQLDIDALVSQHMEKVRIELEDRRKRQARRIIETIEEGMIKRLRAKEEEMDKIGKLNWALEEKVKSLCIENQIWRDLAQTNEATANALRSNLEQVLAAQVKEERTHGAGLDHESVMDDAQSCCGSSGGGGGNNNNNGYDDEGNTTSERLTLAGVVKDKDRRNRMCRNCGNQESCVLLLPCRHLCLCTTCGSSLNTCPICKATKNASFHVNMS